MLKPKSKSNSYRKHRQYAALPIRFTGEGKLQVLLVTSRGTKRWVIPKGWPMRKLSPGATAAQEAYEEAGLDGIIESETPIGSYRYDKGRDDSSTTKVKVDVFLFKVSEQRQTWPERHERVTQWFSPEDAAERVVEPELVALLRRLRPLLQAA